MMARSVLAVTLLLVSGCAGQGPGSGPGPGSPHGSPGEIPADGSRLQGRTFLSTSVTGHQLVPGTRIMLSFPEPGKFTADAGCNHMFGSVSFETGAMGFSELGSTDMACDGGRMEQDEWLKTFLMSKPAWSLSANELVLTADKTELKLLDKKVADPDRHLVGQRWQVESLLDGQSASSVPIGAQAFLEFMPDGKVTGNTGCNSLGGSYTQQDGTITFTDIATTKIACPGDIGALERSVLAVVEGKVEAEISADRLELTHPSGKGLHLKALE